MANYSADVIIAGAGLAGLATAYDLLERGKKVLVLDKDSAGAVGGLARLSFGGICMADTPQQRRTGIKDSPELLHRDWLSYARFGGGGMHGHGSLEGTFLGGCVLTARAAARAIG